MVFLSETICEVNKLKKVQLSWGFPDSFGVTGIGKSRGLGLLWNDDIDLHVLSSSIHYIDVEIGGASMEHPPRRVGMHHCPCYKDLLVLALCLGCVLEILMRFYCNSRRNEA